MNSELFNTLLDAINDIQSTLKDTKIEINSLRITFMNTNDLKKIQELKDVIIDAESSLVTAKTTLKLFKDKLNNK